MRLRPRVLAAAVAAVVAAGGCDHPAPPPEASGALNGAVARVGNVLLAPSLVADVARAKGSSAREAMEDLVRDGLAAQGSLARGFDRDPAVAWQSTSALARSVPEHLFDAAATAGPPRDDELAQVLVEHAVVMRSANLREEDAIALAASIRQAVVGAGSAAEFEARARALVQPRAQVIIQSVGPFGADGTDASGGLLDAGFVAAAYALKAPLDISPVVASPFGWHVIQLVERRPGEGPPADRARDLGPAVIRMRARAQVDALLRARAQAAKVEISSAADALMAHATPGPAKAP